MADVVEINQGDTVIVKDSEGVRYTLRDVFVSDADFDKFKMAEGEEDEFLVPVLDVTLSAFDFAISSMPEDDELSDVCNECEEAACASEAA